MSYKFIICCSGIDRPFALELNKQLRENGYPVFCIVHNVSKPSYVEDDFQSLLSEAAGVAVIWTPNSIQSDVIMNQAYFAKQSNKLISLVAAPCALPGWLNGEKTWELSFDTEGIEQWTNIRSGFESLIFNAAASERIRLAFGDREAFFEPKFAQQKNIDNKDLYRWKIISRHYQIRMELICWPYQKDAREKELYPLRLLVCTLKSGPLFELVPASDMELNYGQEIEA